MKQRCMSEEERSSANSDWKKSRRPSTVMMEVVGQMGYKKRHWFDKMILDSGLSLVHLTRKREGVELVKTVHGS